MSKMMDVVTRKQLAEHLNVTQETIARWEEVEDFPGRKVGRTTLYDVEAIKLWIAAKPRG